MQKFVHLQSDMKYLLNILFDTILLIALLIFEWKLCQKCRSDVF